MDVEVEAHPPERGRRSLILASGCCTSCCCCSCCLHSVGAIAGAAAGAALAAAAPPSSPVSATTDAAGKITVAPAPPAPVSRGAVVLAFWLLSAALTALGLVAGASDLEVAALTIAVVIPLLLGLALLLVLPLAALAGGPGMKAWGKMLAGVAIGTAMGLGAMLFLGGFAMAVFG